jgi:serine/threonine-protein kinase
VTAIRLRIAEGPGAGTEWRYSESDDVIIGSDRPGCEAHLRLPAADRYVSRHHCVLEMRPPNCRLRDLGSKNGTQVRRSGRSAWQQADIVDLNPGDSVRVGQTILLVDVLSEGSEAEAQSVLCIRCAGPIDPTLGEDSFSYGAADFMCGTCRAEVASVRRPEPAVTCSAEGCTVDLSSTADADGRALELESVAVYLCPDCAELQRELIRTSIGGWTLLSQLGQGGMGVVYRAWHSTTGRVAALKHLLQPLGLPPAKRLRFQREIALLQTLRHTQVTRLFEAGEDDGVPYFVAEFVPYGEVSQFVSSDGEPTLAPEAVIRLIADSLEGLEYVHRAGVIHRDIKPANILLRRDDGRYVPKLADFGLSRSYERHGGTITVRGEVGGTMAFLAPEQVLHFKQSRPPVDVYSMGVCLYYLLTGRYPLPFPAPWQAGMAGGLPAALVGRKPPIEVVLEDDRLPVRQYREHLSRALSEVVDTAVQRDANQRFRTAADFRDRLLQTLPVGS